MYVDIYDMYIDIIYLKIPKRSIFWNRELQGLQSYFHKKKVWIYYAVRDEACMMAQAERRRSITHSCSRSALYV
jgi:hypothetical protein